MLFNCHLFVLPHIFRGASNSNKIGCDKNISRDFKHKPRISLSDSWTFLPGLAPRTANINKTYLLQLDVFKTSLIKLLPSNNLDIMLSIFISDMSYFRWLFLSSYLKAIINTCITPSRREFLLFCNG